MKSLREYIIESQQINEMAFEIKEFKNKVLGNSKMLISHVCLCLYSKIYNNGKYFDHWSGEVIKFVENIIKHQLKNKIDKNKTIKRFFIDSEYNTTNGVIKVIKEKFKEEHIDNESRDIIAEMFATHFDDFMDSIIKANEQNAGDTNERCYKVIEFINKLSNIHDYD